MDRNSQEFSIHTLRKGDIEGVLRIERLSFPHPWSPTMFEALYLVNPDGFLIALLEEEVVGYAVVLFEQHLGHLGGRRWAHLMNIAVHPVHQRKGIGVDLVRTIAVRARDTDLNRIYLEVKVSNTGALAFYKTLGFTEISKLKGFYENEDALVLIKELS